MTGAMPAMNPSDPDNEALRYHIASELDEIARTEMPFGRFIGSKLYELPAEYLQWFVGKGWPAGRLGVLMRIVYQMKADGSDVAFDIYRGKAALRRPADS